MSQVSSRFPRVPRVAWWVVAGVAVIVAVAVAYYQFVVLRPYRVLLPQGLSEADLKIPVDNPMTAEKVALGKQLYFDTRLSGDGTIACASCHNPQLGWTDGKPHSTGAGGKTGGRSAPTIINRALSTHQFWDGRAASLEEQALGPIQNPIEMAMSMDDLIPRLQAIPGYREQFRTVFGGDVTAEDAAKAIAAFERTVLSGDSDYDRFVAGDRNALSPDAQRGMALFFGRAQCAVCHSGPNFTNDDFHNLGVGIGPGALPAEPHKEPDLGRYDVTKEAEDRGKFKTPTLRDIARTAPYMHDGSEATLEAVMELYNRGGNRNPNLDPRMLPLNLTEQEKADLVAFMHALTGRMPEVSPPELPQ